jgi:putative transposase
MYAWIDGIHVRVRLDEDKLCLLVVVGMRADGTKELVTLADGHRESACAWADMRHRNMPAPVPAVGGRCVGVLGGAAGGVPRHPRGHDRVAA